MAYTTDILDTRIAIYNREESASSAYGMKAGDYEETCKVWAGWKWTKGVQAMREGALDAYDTILVRTRYNESITRDSRIVNDSRVYQIISLQADKRANEMQIVCTELQK